MYITLTVYSYICNIWKYIYKTCSVFQAHYINYCRIAINKTMCLPFWVSNDQKPEVKEVSS